MLASTAQLFTAIGGVAFAFGVGLYRYHNESGLFAAISLITFAMLAFGADSIVVITETGNTVTQSQPTLQYLSLGLAVVSALAVAGSLTGKWPTGENNERV